eukprot:TRINITY_DN6604_c1_g1_i1.p2 TRINITY_DN6604_c1_g1~~TRINITY_DN6604_c1_g1_i1.p2  ORF type:complete len:155 (+),score=60.19 TRINITY_DN6604_c1_g1_i1:76-540(+)
MDQLSQAQIAEYSEAFSMFDDEGEGVIRLDKMGEVLQSLGMAPFPTWLETMQHQKQEEAEETVDYLEFLSLMGTAKTLQQTAGSHAAARARELRRAFRAFDTNLDGRAPVADVRKTLLAQGMAAGDVDRMLAEADPGDTGHVRYAEFVDLIVQS